METIEIVVEFFIGTYCKYLKLEEKNRTELIKENTEIQKKIKWIEANIEVSHAYFKSRVKKREELFSLSMKVLDCSIEHGNLIYAKSASKLIEIMQSHTMFAF